MFSREQQPGIHFSAFIVLTSTAILDVIQTMEGSIYFSHLDRQALFFFSVLMVLIPIFTILSGHDAVTMADKMPPEKCRFSTHDSIHPGLSFNWVRKDS